MKAKELAQLGDSLFAKRTSLTMLWQEQAENFYPERADFTLRRSLGVDFASNLMSSYPIICRRELGDQFSTMLRPTNKRWMHVVPRDESLKDNDTKRWLEFATDVQRRAMYDPVTLFTRATKEGDNDFATFGQCVISGRVNKNQNALLYRCWHLRDCAWIENAEGKICATFVKWKPTARTMKQMFGDKVHRDIDSQMQNNTPLAETNCYHMVMEADMFDGDARGQPYFSVYWDSDHEHELEAVATWNKEYVVPRWQTVSGSQYAYSPATVAALPDARLLQAMTYTLLEAGEKLTNPPMIATQDAVRSDVAIHSGGITWVDRDYDERYGEVLRPMTLDAKGMPIGIEMQAASRQMIAAAFYLNKLTLPQRAPEMTAYEIGQRIQEYIRGAMPLFEPMEHDYNGQLCDLTFEILRRYGAFGAPDMMPARLRGAEVTFRFESPLHDAIEAQKGQIFLEMNQLISQAVALDRGASAIADIGKALRDSLAGIGVPAEWTRNETTVAQIQAAQQAAVEAEQMLAAAQAGSEVVGNLATAAKEGAAAGI